ncbi:hypothetical protein IAR55_005623 [Kwoniella newhampshirensis]|uniref:Uncharacterized protein n=1 Tax=Kwoniella newhampshirensis TaxID=1651941 RepID=A0AAW0YKI1_9TREE
MAPTRSQPPSPCHPNDYPTQLIHSQSIPFSSLPARGQQALYQPGKTSNPTTPHLTNILMPVTPSAENIDTERERELAAPASRAEKRDSMSMQSGAGGKGWVEGVDYAYEYVPVSQRRQGRKNM